MTPLAAILVVLGAPAIASVVGYLLPARRWPPIATVASALIITTIGASALFGGLYSQAPQLGGTFRIDSLAAILLVVIGSVGTLAAWASPPYLDYQLSTSTHPERHPRRIYWTLFNLFCVAMVAAVVSNNLGVTWVAIEATTIATTFLVGFKRTPLSLEAAWKYAIICSFGIAIALLGVVFIYFAGLHAGLSSSQALQINALILHAKDLNHGVIRLGIGLCILGFGAKAGLVPFHSWLPDAHSQAPAPISAMMSGVLLSVAISIVVRVAEISDAALGVSYARDYLVTMGLLSMGVAALLLLGQRDLKRMLAQSSIEQMGLVAVAAAINTELAVAALLLHVLVHGIAKSVAFIAAGQIERTTHTTKISEITGVLAHAPKVAIGFLLATVALVALPPFGLFWSEAAIVTSAFQANMVPVALVALVFLVIASASLSRAALSMTLGSGSPIKPGTVIADSSIPVIIGVVAAILIGVIGSPTTLTLLNAAHSILPRA
ncbi:MAG: proton-conducting transporter transmembrane domain-containing protein [Ferrimicrobium sp.]